MRASVHNWKKWLRSLNPNSRTTRSSRSRFSRRTLVVRFGLCCNLVVKEFSMARRCSHAALRSEKITSPFEQPCDATSYYREGQSEYLVIQTRKRISPWRHKGRRGRLHRFRSGGFGYAVRPRKTRPVQRVWAGRLFEMPAKCPSCGSRRMNPPNS
jgi:hypothetical protein